MRILIQDHGSAADLVVRRALDILLEAGIYTADGGGIFGDRPLLLIDATHVPEAVAALNKAGIRATIA
jgi:hypothetical protein